MRSFHPHARVKAWATAHYTQGRRAEGCAKWAETAEIFKASASDEAADDEELSAFLGTLGVAEGEVLEAERFVPPCGTADTLKAIQGFGFKGGAVAMHQMAWLQPKV